MIYPSHLSSINELKMLAKYLGKQVSKSSFAGNTPVILVKKRPVFTY
jgi:hypothetical protein